MGVVVMEQHIVGYWIDGAVQAYRDNDPKADLHTAAAVLVGENHGYPQDIILDDIADGCIIVARGYSFDRFPETRKRLMGTGARLRRKTGLPYVVPQPGRN